MTVLLKSLVNLSHVAKLHQAIEYFDKYSKTMPDNLKQWFEAPNPEPEMWPYESSDVLEWLLNATQCLTLVDRKTLTASAIPTVERLFRVAHEGLKVTPSNQISDTLTDDLGQVWTLTNPMSNGQTIGSLLEMLELERAVDLLKQDTATMLPKVCALYLRVEGEQFDTKDIATREQYFSKHLNYTDALQVFFFMLLGVTDVSKAINISLGSESQDLEVQNVEQAQTILM